jgi:2-methylisocitrate lyase-like PEP mutase family enzyme
MTRVKELFKPGNLITAPGIFDGISARMADPLGFDLLYMTGYGTVASYLGMPDAGIASYADMVGRVQMIASVVKTPFIADGDTGYGGLLNMHHTVKGYEAAGAVGIQIEDQEFPKKCGHTPGREQVTVSMRRCDAGKDLQKLGLTFYLLNHQSHKKKWKKYAQILTFHFL